MALLLTMQSAFVTYGAEQTGFDINNPELIKLIEADQELIAKQGYGNLVVPQSVNQICPEDFEADALWVCQQLHDAGYKAYFIGGAVRDLEMGKLSAD